MSAPPEPVGCYRALGGAGRRIRLAATALDLNRTGRGGRFTPVPSQSGHGGGSCIGFPNCAGRIFTSCPVPKHVGQRSLS
jgi:hypothetical protein